MNITIIGTGYVGLVSGACLADLGNHVVCLDVDQTKVDLLNSGGVPIFEPGLNEVIDRNVKAGRLTFSTDVSASVDHGSVQFIAVGTPPDEDGSADLQYVITAARSIGRYMNEFKVVVGKSTVPVGTGDKIAATIQAELDIRFPSDFVTSESPQLVSTPTFAVVSNPEFLKEGAAIEDFTRPDRIVLGVSDDVAGQQALVTLRQLFSPLNRNHERICVMGVRSAEFTKYAANAMLATRISFMNELANLAEQLGADIELVRQGIGSDPRIGHSFLYAGTGFGGSCFPKDLKALIQTGHQHGQSLRILEAVQAVNEDQKNVLVQKVFARFGRDLSGKTFALWGLAFKPDTNDMRDAPSRIVMMALLHAGAHILAHDPVAEDEVRCALELDFADAPSLLKSLRLVGEPMEAVQGADALIIITEWKVYRSPNWAALKTAMKDVVIFDGRNLYDPGELRNEGIEYHGIGRTIMDARLQELR